jgi:hypothetical protein
VGKLLRAWSRDGEKGRLFDGVSNIRIDGRVAHFELGQIPEHATEMRAAANFLVANYGRQKIITMPRSVPKIAIFEEAARTLEIPGGVRMIQEYYRQMRKFGCNILAVVQQYDVLKASEVRGAMVGNFKMFLKLIGDHGCDVVVLGWGAQRENVLIQCKATSHDELDSELAVREVEGARPYYESALGVSFHQRCLHTTARRLSKRTLHAARICKISVHDRAWLSAELGRSRISLADLLAKDAIRERVE